MFRGLVEIVNYVVQFNPQHSPSEVKFDLRNSSQNPSR